MKYCTILIIMAFSIASARAGYDPKDPKGYYPRPGGFDIDQKAQAEAIAKAQAEAQGVGIGGNAQGGQATIENGAMQNSTTNNMNNVGSPSLTWRNPRQTPMAYAPPPLGKKAYTGGISTPIAGFSFGIPVDDSAEDQARYDANLMNSWHYPASVPCNRMMQIGENKKALQDSGLTCKDVQQYIVAHEVENPPPVPMNALNAYVPGTLMDGYPTRDEMNQKIDSAFKKSVGK